MDVNHVNPFLESTISVFESLMGESPEAGTPSLLGKFHTHRWDISGVIGIVGAADGVIALRLTLGLVEKILENSGVICEDEEERNDIVNSMVGEIINMVAGNTVGKIDQYDLNITVPLVIQGENHSIAWPRNTPIITVPFHLNTGFFEVNFSLKENKLYMK
jgi:chemotaxis protein CheX